MSQGPNRRERLVLDSESAPAARTYPLTESSSTELRLVNVWCDCDAPALHTLCDTGNGATFPPYLMRTFATGEHQVFTEHCSLGTVHEFVEGGRWMSMPQVPLQDWFVQMVEVLAFLEDSRRIHGGVNRETVFVADMGRSIRMYERAFGAECD